MCVGKICEKDDVEVTIVRVCVARWRSRRKLVVVRCACREVLPSEGRGPLVCRLRDVDRIACCGRMMRRLVVFSLHDEAATSA